MILDGGTTNIGIESTVLDVTKDTPVILRPGWVTREKLEEVIGPVASAASERELSRSPGTRYRHYSPRARVLLIENAAPEFLRQVIASNLADGPVGFIGHSRVDIHHPQFHGVSLHDSPQEYAQTIYAALRELDEQRPRVIIVEGISASGEGAAVMDRLRRAASEILRGGANAGAQETEPH
jgi:L-threonylcarbamoyladenylate synthase